MSLPVQSLSIANVLNGKADSHGIGATGAYDGFGSSGKGAIELVKSRDYDIVFMDHLMPEIDGIETTAAIRSWENNSNLGRQVPIIALTANAVVGMKEMLRPRR